MALIVEDGTGIDDAESYISVADAITYFANFGGSNEDWDNAGEPEREVALRNATRSLDLMYGESYAGDLLTSTQALLIPRTSYRNSQGQTISGVPTNVKYATAELAALILSGKDPLGSVGDADRVKEKTVKAGGVESKKVYFYPQGKSKPFMAKVSTLMAGALDSALATGPFVQVVRG